VSCGVLLCGACVFMHECESSTLHVRANTHTQDVERATELGGLSVREKMKQAQTYNYTYMQTYMHTTYTQTHNVKHTCIFKNTCREREWVNEIGTNRSRIANTIVIRSAKHRPNRHIISTFDLLPPCASPSRPF